jgi:hypothetical protein
MTEQPSSPVPDSPVGELAPVNFQLQSDDGYAAVYQAVVAGEAPDLPVYTLTVTIASSVRQQAGQQLQVFLDTMRVAFAILPGPVPPDDGPDDGEPFDIGSQLEIEPGLVRFQGEGPVAVGVTVATTTGIGQAPSASDSADGPATGRSVTFHVGPNLDHYWHSRGNHSFTATVTPTSGSGTIRNPVTFVAVDRGGRLTARQVIVHGNPPGGMDYLFSGRFRG